MRPYAVYLLERFKAGEIPEELALREGIPLERIRTRLAAAAEFRRKREANVYRPSGGSLEARTGGTVERRIRVLAVSTE